MNISILRKIILGSLVIAILGAPSFSCAFSWNDVTAKDVAKGAALGLGAYAAYKITLFVYEQFNKQLENKIIDESADHIVLALTSNTTIKKLPAAQREAALRTKARLICMRKRIIDNIKQKLSNPACHYSLEHQTILQERINLADLLFGGLDLVRGENEYEKEYETPTTIDAFVESKIIDSIILTCKPAEECNIDELNQKQKIESRREKIIQKASSKISSIWGKKLLGVALVALILTKAS